MSTSILQHLLLKQHNEKEESESQGSSERGSLSELSAVSLPLIPPNKDYCVTVAQLLQYIHGLVVRPNSKVSVKNMFCNL